MFYVGTHVTNNNITWITKIPELYRKARAKREKQRQRDERLLKE